jgi:hypothetical protein
MEQASNRNTTYGSDFYSLSARSSVCPEQTHNYNAYSSHRSSQDSESSWQEVSQQTESYYSTPVVEAMPWYLQEWARKNEAQAAVSRNGSSNFLPIQHHVPEHDPSSEEDHEMEDSGKELMGLGLYDTPDADASWSSGLVESTGKGLKLEETWEPPAEDEDAEDEDDASSDDGSVEELSMSNNVQEQLPVVHEKTSDNMNGQSFFFEDDETYTKEWWFHQLKQPTTLPVRDAGLGYDWL